MEHIETIIKKQLEYIQSEPEKDLRNKILENATAGTNVIYSVKCKNGLFAVLLASVLGVFLLMSAFTIINVVQQFAFGNSNVMQVPENIYANIVKGSGAYSSGYVKYQLVNQIEVPGSLADGVIVVGDKLEFSTIEEARISLPLIKTPVHIPENIEVDEIYVWVPGSKAVDTVRISYTDGIEKETRLSFSQRYIGPDAYINLTTTYPVQKVMVGDVEATVIIEKIPDELLEVLPSAADDIILHSTLYWINEGFLYELRGTYDLENLIVIAESVVTPK